MSQSGRSQSPNLNSRAPALPPNGAKLNILKVFRHCTEMDADDSPLETGPVSRSAGQPAQDVRIGANEISFSSVSEELAAQRRREEKLAALAAKRTERLAARDDRRAATAGAKADGGSMGVATPEEFDALFGSQVKGGFSWSGQRFVKPLCLNTSVLTVSRVLGKRRRVCRCGRGHRGGWQSGSRLTAAARGRAAGAFVYSAEWAVLCEVAVVPSPRLRIS